MGGIVLWAVTWSKQEKPGSVKHRFVTYRGVLSLLCNCPQSLCSFFPSFSSPLSSFLLFTVSSYLFTSHPHSCLSLSIQCLTFSMDSCSPLTTIHWESNPRVSKECELPVLIVCTTFIAVYWFKQTI